ncbi:ATP-binding protein [Magnetovibrio sp. PR-2]|uniref:ATP-binding protein n=1 Tax=Magnetovibrio sp. PR-2 TaxID=3120356 RepID=UPI002FCE0551
MLRSFSSIRQRVLLAFFFLAFIGVASSVWDVYLLKQYEKRLDALSHENVPVLIAAYEVARQGEAISKGASGVVLTRDRWTRQAFVNRITEQFNGLDDQLQVLSKKGIEEARLSFIQENKDALQNSFAELARAVELKNEAVRDNHLAVVPALSAEVDRLLLLHRNHAERLTFSVAALARSRKVDIESAIDETLEQIDVESRMLNAYALVSIFLTIAVAIFLDRRVSTRLVKIQRAMRSVADGDSKQEIPRGGSDEISDMADALGTFVEKLGQREERLQELVAERTSQLKQTKDNLVISERRLRNLFEVASDWFWEADGEMRLKYLSSDFFEAMDHPPDIIGAEIFERLKADDIESAPGELEQLNEAMRAHQSFVRFEFKLRTPKGGDKYLQSAGVAVFDEDGGFEGYQGALLDITDVRQKEIEMRHAQKIQALGNLAGGMAHSFNNIFQPIMILSELSMLDAEGDSQLKTRLQIAIDACKRGKSLSDRILLYSRQEDPKRERINVQNMLEATLELFRTSKPSSIVLVEDFAEDVGDIYGDGAQLEALLLNMATNAVDALGGRKGEIKISLTPSLGQDAEFDVGYEEHYQRYAKITISDNGCGMASTLVERIFDPFFTTKGLGKGTGLGLSMASGIVTMHGGGIKVNSRVGQGTVFHIYLPFADETGATPIPVDLASFEGV